MRLIANSALLVVFATSVAAFAPSGSNGNYQKSRESKARMQQSATVQSEELIATKKELMELLGNKKYEDPVLADPDTKEPIEITTPGVLIGGDSRRRNVQYKIQSASNSFQGSKNSFSNTFSCI